MDFVCVFGAALLQQLHAVIGFGRDEFRFAENFA